MKNTLIKMKNTLQGINSGVDEAEEDIRDLDNKEAEYTQSEQKKEKKIQKYEDSIRSLWDNFKHTNICIVGVPEREKKELGIENLCKK